MANFWGAATEGFNQGLSEALKRAAEKRQRDFSVEQRDLEWKRQDDLAKVAREQALADDLMRYNREDPIAQWTPSPYQDPIGAMLNPGSLGAAQRRSDVEFGNKLTLFDAQMREMDKRMAVPDGPSGSVLVPGDKWPGYYADPNQDGQAWVPGSIVDNATTPRGQGWGGGGSPVNELVDVPLSAVDPQYKGLFAEQDEDGDGIVQMPRSQMLKVVIATKPQVSTDEDADRALRYARGGVDEKGNWSDGMLPKVIDQSMTADQWASFESAFKDEYKASGSQSQAVEAGYSALSLKESFPKLSINGSALTWNRPHKFDVKYAPSEFEKFYKEFGKENELSRALAEKLWSEYFTPQTGALPPAKPAPAANEDPEDAYLRDAGIKL